MQGEEVHEETTLPGLEALEERRAAVASLLLDLGTALHAASLPSPLVERRLNAIARALGVHAEIFVLQGFIAIETAEGHVARADLRRVSFESHWNLNRLHELVDLCGALAQGKLGVAAGRAALEHISDQPRRLYARWLVVLSYAVYGAAVAARVGGGWREVLAGGIVGLVAGVIHFETLRYEHVDLQKSFVAAFVGGLTALALSFLLPPFDVGRALFGGITLLVPAMVITIGTYELANDALESGVARVAYGLLRFLMLAFGVALAMRIYPLFAPLPPRVVAVALPRPVILLLVAVGGVALTGCLQGRKTDLPWIAGATLLAFGAQELTKVVFGGRGSPLLAALILGFAANVYGRFSGKVPGTITIPGLLQLAPGFLGTQAVFDLLGGDSGGLTTGPEQVRFFDVLMTGLQLVMGLVLADVLSGRRARARIEGTPAPVP